MAYSTHLFNVILLIGSIQTLTTIDNIDYEADTTTSISYGDDLEVNLSHAWGGHKVPDTTIEKWKEWLKNYYVQKEKDKLDTDDHNDPNRPRNWKGYGGGHKALPQPPPWAYEPINIGLPDYCYLPPSYGSCSSKKQQRYAYNPYTDECVTFTYGGCYGNQNNFPTEWQCKAMCIRHWPKG